jgi:O-antigen/teichoic acid export membrane protein
VATLTDAPAARRVEPARDDQRVLRDSVAVSLGGQLERAIGTLTAFALRWGLDPASLGVYTGLRLFLDNTNRSSLGVGLGAVQEIPILRAAGREAEAQQVADAAHTTNTLTCLAYALALIAWAAWRAPGLGGDPLAAEWTWGLVATAGLALIKRYETFLVAVLRARGEFLLTSELDVVEAVASAIAVGLGLWLAGFWGLLAAVGALLLAKIAYAHARSDLRFRWRWDPRLVWRLMTVGLPILANTAVFGAVLTVDRAVILARLPDAERAAGLYSVAVLGTSWALDLAGRIVLVLYNAFQTTLGRTSAPLEVARQAMRAAEAQAPVLLAGSAAAYVVGPTFLGAVLPHYAAGLPALRPLLPGMVLLGMAWPARQMLIAVGRPYVLFAATLGGLAAMTSATVIGADAAGIVGVAWGVSIGGAAVFLLTSAAASTPWLGLRAWLGHLGRLGCWAATFALATAATAHAPLGALHPWVDAAARAGLLAAWGLPLGAWWAKRQGVWSWRVRESRGLRPHWGVGRRNRTNRNA